LAYVTNQGIRIHYEIEGHGPPMLLLHGFAGSLDDWRGFGYVDVLKRAYRLILLDERGHGRSDKPRAAASYAMCHRVADVLAVLDALAVDQAYVCGYSMGGEVAFALAQTAPERVKALLVGGMHPYEAAHPDAYDQAIALLKEGIGAAAAAWAPLERRQRFLRNDAEALIASMEAARDWGGLGERMTDISMPSLFYVGEEDTLMLPGIQSCAQQVLRATFVVLPGMDHSDVYERSEVVLPHLANFLESLS
jgi:pimeloyl-ACP methyl ester carboxylesterase